MPETVEAIVIARNESRNIGDCLRCLLWADGMTVLDDCSEDDTRQIAVSLGARVIEHRMSNYSQQRNVALEAASGDWVFFVDADERCTPALAAEISEVIHGEEKGWWVPRDNYIFGRLTRYAGWYPDYQLRLLRRGSASYDASQSVHEVAALSGKEGWLQNPIVHYNYSSLRQFIQKQERYANLEAAMLARELTPPRKRSLISQPLREFKRRFVDLEGYREGAHGFLLSALLAYYKFVAYERALRGLRAL